MPLTEKFFRSPVSVHCMLLAAALALGGCGRALTDQDFVQKGKEAQEQGKLADAEIQLKNALQKNPDNVEARRRLGEVYVLQGKGKAGEEQLLRAKALGANAVLIGPSLGEAYLLQGLYNEALATVQPESTMSPRQVATILEIRGRATMGLNDWASGCKLFDQAVEADPAHVPSLRDVARCYVGNGDIDKARMFLKKAFDVDVKDTLTWTALGDLEEAANRVPEAEAAYTHAIDLRKDNTSALLSRAVIRIENSKLEEANKDVQAALSSSSGLPMAHHLAGVILYKKGNFVEAQNSFESALRLNPSYMPAVLWLGLANYAQSNYEQAAVRFTQFSRAFPSVRVQSLLALTQAKMGLKSDVDATLASLRDVNINDPQSLAMLAQANVTLGQFDRAEKYLRLAVQQRPDEPELRVSLATTLSQKGQRGEAIQQLQDAVRLDPDRTNAELLLIQNLIRDKQFDQALQAADKAEKREPKNAAVFNLKAAAYLGKNDYANARVNFERAANLKPGSVASAMNLAQLDLRENNPEAARRRFEKVLENNKNSVDAMIGLARVAGAVGNEAEYVSWLEKASRSDKASAQPRVLLADYYLKKRNVNKALEFAQQAQSIAPADPQVLDVFAAAQLAAGQNENALVVYRKLAAATPNDPKAHYKLAGAYAANKDMASARAALNRALVLQPDYEDAEVLLAFLELGASRFLEAQRIASQILQQHPESIRGLMLQGDASMGQRQFDAAREIYKKALEKNATGVLAVRVHESWTAAGHRKEADDWLAHWLDEHPKEMDARAYMARSLASDGQTRLAIAQYERLLDMDPNSLLAMNNLAWLYQKEGDPRALATAERAQQAWPDRPEVLDTLGWILVQQGQSKRGLDLLNKAVEMAPRVPAVRYHAAVAMAKSGDRLGAQRALQSLLSSEKNFPERGDAEAFLSTLAKPS